MKCKKCGFELQDTKGFCPNCGEKINSNLKKILFIIIAFVLVAAMAVSIYFIGINRNNEQNNSGKLTDNAKVSIDSKVVQRTPLTGDVNTEYEMSSTLFDYTMSIGDNVYKFPMPVKELELAGFCFCDFDKDAYRKVPKTCSDSCYFKFKDGSIIKVYIFNYCEEECELEDCYVSGMEINLDDENVNFTDYEIELAQGIVLGESDTHDLELFWGEGGMIESGTQNPNDIYYAQSENDYVMVTIDDNKIVRGVSIKTTDCYDKTYKNMNYSAPKKLGKDLGTGEFLLEGKVYKMPVPVSELFKDGWVVDSGLSSDARESVSDPLSQSVNFIETHRSRAVNFRKGNVKLLNVQVSNGRAFKAPICDCLIEYLGTSNLDKTAQPEFKISYGLNVNSSLSEVKKACDGIDEEHFDVTVYDNSEDNYDCTIENEDGNKTFISFKDGKIDSLTMSFYLNFIQKEDNEF